MWRLACYISQDERKTGLTYHKAGLRFAGIFLWESNWWQRLYSYFTIINTICCGTSILLYAMESFKAHTTHGFLEFVKAVVLVFTFFFLPFKLILIKFFGIGEKMREAVDFLESQDLTGGVDTSQNARRIIQVFTGTLFSTGVGWSVFNLIHEGDIYRTHWPFPPLKPDFIFLPIAVSYMVVGHGTTDSMFPMLVTYVAYQATKLDILLEMLGDRRHEDRETLKKAVEQHIILIKSMRRIKSAYEVLFSLEVVYAVLHSCVIAFSALKVNNVGIVMTGLIPMLFSAYGQLFVFCQAGERANNIMKEITFKIYDNEWYNCDLVEKKSIVLMMKASNKEIALDGVGPFVASFHTYLQSVQESFSYFVALKTISAKY